MADEFEKPSSPHREMQILDEADESYQVHIRLRGQLTAQTWDVLNHSDKWLHLITHKDPPRWVNMAAVEEIAVEAL